MCKTIILTLVLEDEMGGACKMHGRAEECVQNLGQKGRDHSEDLGVDGKITLEWILKK
jgi:hypothetical protein